MHPKRADDADPDSAAAEPYEIDAQRIEVRGQNELKAQGSVQMRRGDLNASADTLSYLNETGQLLLSGSASLDVETYLLTGGLIVVTMAEDEIQDILARRNAHLTGDLDIEGGFIQLELSDGQLEGVTAGPDPEAGAAARPADVTPQPQGGRGAPTSGGASASNAPSPRQATASSEELTITADRLDIDVTAGALQRLDARGRARLVTRGADSLNTAETPEVARSDWIEGDTINALFTPPDSAGADTVASAMADSVFTDMEVDPDSAKHPRLELLIARVNARALYRLPPADTASGGNPACTGPGRFAVHYVVGDSITITMQDDEVDEMNVVGQVVGQHLEPPACAPASPADTTAAPVPAPADTTAPARPPAGGTPRPEPAVGSPHRPSDAQGETPALPGRPTGSIRRPGRIRPRARREPERTR